MPAVAPQASSIYTPHLLLWVDDFTYTNPILDKSGNGNDLSAAFAKDWAPGQVSRLIVQDRTQQTQTPPLFRCLQSPGSNATTSASRPPFRGNDASTCTDGTITWTAKQPAFTITNNRYVMNVSASNKSCLMCKNVPGWPGAYAPFLKDATSYSAATISFALQTINDSANGLGLFQVGDWVLASGAPSALNNQYGQVLTASAGTLTFTAPFGPGAVAAAGPTITLKKVLPPWGWISAFWINTVGTTSRLNMPLCETVWNAAWGWRAFIDTANSRLLRATFTDINTGTTTQVDSAVGVPSGQDTHVVMACDNARGTFTVFLNGVQAAQVNMPAGTLIDCRPPAGQVPYLDFSYMASTSITGATTWWQPMFFAGANMPVITNAMATNMMNDIPILASDWP